MLHVKGWGWLEGDTKWTPESPAKSVPSMAIVHYSLLTLFLLNCELFFKSKLFADHELSEAVPLGNCTTLPNTATLLHQR